MDRKDAERAYPDAVGEGGRTWLRTKPFQSEPAEVRRLLVAAALVIELLDLRVGTTLCELGCGSGWLCRLIARQGAAVVGYDISPGMISIAREQAEQEGLEIRFEVADMEMLEPDQVFDACLIYDALHHSSRPDLVFATARRALRPGGRLLLSEPNWMHRFGGRNAAARYGVTETGYTPHRLKRLLRDAGFDRVERLHRHGRRSLYGNRPSDIVRHLGAPVVQRALAPFWTDVWMRARAA